MKPGLARRVSARGHLWNLSFCGTLAPTIPGINSLGQKNSSVQDYQNLNVTKVAVENAVNTSWIKGGQISCDRFRTIFLPENWQLRWAELPIANRYKGASCSEARLGLSAPNQKSHIPWILRERPECCFECTVVGIELTEFCTKLCEFSEKLDEFAMAHKS